MTTQSADKSYKQWRVWAQQRGDLNTESAWLASHASRDAEVAELKRLLDVALEANDNLRLISERIAKLLDCEPRGKHIEIAVNDLKQEVARLSDHIRAIAEHHGAEVKFWNADDIDYVPEERTYHTERRDFALSIFT